MDVQSQLNELPLSTVSSVQHFQLYWAAEQRISWWVKVFMHEPRTIYFPVCIVSNWRVCYWQLMQRREQAFNGITGRCHSKI